MPRWQRDWLNNQLKIKLSTIVQYDVIIPMIKQSDPEYFAKFGSKEIELEKVEFIAEEKFVEKVIRTEEKKKYFEKNNQKIKS